MANKVLFRASEVGILMVEPREKRAKEAGELSETAKTFIEDIWLEKNYGFKEPVFTKEMFKGIECEQDSISLISKVFPSQYFRSKNRTTYKSEYFTGTPDIILLQENLVEDVKTSWDIRTFFKVREIPTLYFAQAQVYMYLTDCKKFRLLYCLVNTPEELIMEEEKRFFFKFGCNEENKHYIECCTQIRKNHNFDHIPAQERVKKFDIEFDPNYIEALEKKAKRAIEYYDTLALSKVNI